MLELLINSTTKNQVFWIINRQPNICSSDFLGYLNIANVKRLGSSGPNPC